MIRVFLLVFASVFFFVSGFLCGVYWNSAEPSPAVPVVQVAEEPAATDHLSEEERRMAEALRDPDFKRVHDHLMRESPIQMTIPETPAKKESVPMSERPPVQFLP